MRRVTLSLLCSMICFCALATGSAQNSVREEIRRVLDAQASAWNKGDLETFMETYWNSENLTFFSGDQPVKGWRNTLDRYRKRYQAEGQEMGRVTFSEIEIELLGEEAGFVRGRWALSRSGQPDAGGLFTLLVRRFEDGWKIIHDHTSAGD